MRVLIFGDGAWATNSLLALVRSDIQPIGVVIRQRPSDSTLEHLARSLAIPVYQPSNVNSEDFVRLALELRPDLGVSISYNQILRQPILDSAQLGIVNFHAGKLPGYRGRNVINWAIINGESEIGLTAHFVDKGIDTGDIIHQMTLPILWKDGYGDVLNRVVDTFPSFVSEVLERIASGQITTRSQSELPGTYFPGREDGDEWLDWSDTSLNLYNKIRAISRPGPGARTSLGHTEVIVWSAMYDESWPKYIATPGQVSGYSGDGAIVKTGDSTLVLREVQIEHLSCQKPSWRIGTRLGIDVVSALHAMQTRIHDLESLLESSGRSHAASTFV
jgi:methionyl-tRNA formyltransferase